MKRAGRNAEYWLSPHGLLSMLYYSTQNHQPRGVTTQSELTLSQINQKSKNEPQECLQSSLWQCFLCSSPFLNDSKLCQADVKQAGTINPSANSHINTLLLSHNFSYLLVSKMSYWYHCNTIKYTSNFKNHSLEKFCLLVSLTIGVSQTGWVPAEECK